MATQEVFNKDQKARNLWMVHSGWSMLRLAPVMSHSVPLILVTPKMKKGDVITCCFPGFVFVSSSKWQLWFWTHSKIWHDLANESSLLLSVLYAKNNGARGNVQNQLPRSTDAVKSSLEGLLPPKKHLKNCFNIVRSSSQKGGCWCVNDLVVISQIFYVHPEP